MDRIQPPPNYYGAPYPQPQGVDLPHSNFAPPPSMQPSANRQETPKEDTNPYEPIEKNDYLTKFMGGHTGQKVKIFCSFTDSASWHDMIFEGLVWGAGDDYSILYDESKKIHTLIMAVYILYIEFSEIDKK